LGSVVWSLARLVDSLPQYAEEFRNLLNYLLNVLEGAGVRESQLREYIAGLDLSTFSGVAQRLLSGITGGASLLLLVVTVVVFLAFDAAGMSDRLALIRQSRPNIADGLAEFAVRVRQYWVVTTVFGALVAIMDIIALLIIGVPLALTWGVLAFVTNYIPNIGFVLGVIPPALIALLDGGAGPMLAVIIVYTAINVVVQTLIQPRFTGDAVGITATVAFVSLIVWANLLGALGALLAVPATLFLKSLLVDHSPNNRWFAALVDSAPRRRMVRTFKRPHNP
jgi:AI-2 transport protein TqsA